MPSEPGAGGPDEGAARPDNGVAIIVAAAENGVIGRDGAIPWRLKTDMAHFKALTMGHTLVTGRLTHQSIGRPLPGRRTIVVTSQHLDGVDCAPSLGAALAMAGRPVFVAGGARLYEEALGVADTIHLSRVHASPHGDTHFPVIDDTVFRCIARQTPPRGPRDDHAVTFLTYRRRFLRD